MKMALWDIYFVSKFIIKVSNNEDDYFLSICPIDFAYLCIFDAAFKVIIAALSQKIFDTNLGIPESRKLSPGLICGLIAYFSKPIF